MIVGVVLLLVVGVVGVVVGFLAQRRTDAMGRTLTAGCAEVGGVAGQGDPVRCEVAGTAEPAQQALTGPFSGTPCVWYRTAVSRRYRDIQRDSDGGQRTVTRTESVSAQESSEPFAVRDASGSAWVYPEGADVIGENRTVDRFEPYDPHRERTPTSGSLAERAITLGMNLLSQTRESTIGYEYEEWVLRAGSTVYVLAGAARDHTGRAWLQRPASGPFLISTRSEAELTRKARLRMRVGFGVGAAATAGGLVWGAVLLLT